MVRGKVEEVFRSLVRSSPPAADGTGPGTPFSSSPKVAETHGCWDHLLLLPRCMLSSSESEAELHPSILPEDRDRGCPKQCLNPLCCDSCPIFEIAVV